MAVEILAQESYSTNSAELVYLVTGETSTSAARTAVLAAAPSTYNSLSRRSNDVQVDEQEGQDGSGNQVYEVTVPYGTGGGAENDDLGIGNTRILFSTIGGSTHITQSLSTEHTFGEAENHVQAIGVDTEGNVAGTDILTGAFDFSIVKVIDSTDLDTSYVGDLLSLTTPNPHTNNATFSHTDTDGRAISFPAGEVLFVGCSNSPRGDGTDELRFEFKASKNLTDALPASGWTIAKDGWEHLWLRYKQDVDGAANRMVTQAASAYVEKIYNSGNFALLAI